MFKNALIRTGIAIVVAALGPSTVVAQDADTVYLNGNVYTVDEVFSKACLSKVVE